MPTSKSRKRKPPKRVLALPDLEHAKTAVLNSLSSASGQRTYEHAIRVRDLGLSQRNKTTADHPCSSWSARRFRASLAW